MKPRREKIAVAHHEWRRKRAEMGNAVVGHLALAAFGGLRARYDVLVEPRLIQNRDVREYPTEPADVSADNDWMRFPANASAFFARGEPLAAEVEERDMFTVAHRNRVRNQPCLQLIERRGKHRQGRGQERSNGLYESVRFLAADQVSRRQMVRPGNRQGQPDKSHERRERQRWAKPRAQQQPGEGDEQEGDQMAVHAVLEVIAPHAQRVVGEVHAEATDTNPRPRPPRVLETRR